MQEHQHSSRYIRILYMYITALTRQRWYHAALSVFHEHPSPLFAIKQPTPSQYQIFTMCNSVIPIRTCSHRHHKERLFYKMFAIRSRTKMCSNGTGPPNSGECGSKHSRIGDLARCSKLIVWGLAVRGHTQSSRCSGLRLVSLTELCLLLRDICQRLACHCDAWSPKVTLACTLRRHLRRC
ncbi:hypothetical protein BV22DRAFT_600040 [Leucogyrophana mollusca]|uniref:Uncharacterized protein n=1 Tax=Leucogyrophana mollusca TaxID=85980 RepID=A0ACB8BD68_9AGAM|nr:hypothetical protein BV22DRAFT_600040 [Leucogyrophana mollusca]